MKAIISFTLFTTILAASNSSLPTIRSTIISTLPCSSSTSSVYNNSSSTSPVTSSSNILSSATLSSDTLSSSLYNTTTTTSSDSFYSVSNVEAPIETTTDSESYVGTFTHSGDRIATEDPVQTTTESESYSNDPISIAGNTRAIEDPISKSETTGTNADSTQSQTITEDPAESENTTEDPIGPITTSETFSTLVTITSCSNSGCTLVTETSGYTTSISGDTTFTSLQPLANSKQPESKTTNFYTTVVTEYLCQDDSCTALPKTTGLTVITHSDTVYTTFCPLSSQSETPRSTQIPTTTVNVFTSNIITETGSPAIQTFIPELVPSTTPQVGVYEPIYEGGVEINKVSNGVWGIVLSLVLLLL